MPRNNRIADTINFLRGAAVSPAGESLKMPVADWINENAAAIPQQVTDAMSQGSKGTELTRKYRRAMILILCYMNNTPPARAKQAVDMIMDANLQNSLGNMLADVDRLAGPRLLGPALQSFLGGPQNFLLTNRIKIGRGAIKTSCQTPYTFFRDCPSKLYIIEPQVQNHHNFKLNLAGFNIHVQMYSSVKNNLGAIQGAPVLGDVALTTQLSGCTVIYSVQGGNLVAAHIMPDPGVAENLPADLQPHAGKPLGVLMGMRLARDASLANGVPGGTLGFYSMVDTDADLNLRNVGARNVRVHGYRDTLGNAYFLGSKSAGGSWQLLCQQNNPGRADAGVGRSETLYP